MLLLLMPNPCISQLLEGLLEALCEALLEFLECRLEDSLPMGIYTCCLS